MRFLDIFYVTRATSSASSIGANLISVPHMFWFGYGAGQHTLTRIWRNASCRPSYADDGKPCRHGRKWDHTDLIAMLTPDKGIRCATFIDDECEGLTMRKLKTPTKFCQAN